jgi:hypothetical protein
VLCGWQRARGNAPFPRCLLPASSFGVMAMLGDSPRPGKEPEITAEAPVWFVSLACQEHKELGYPHELRAAVGYWPNTLASKDRR